MEDFRWKLLEMKVALDESGLFKITKLLSCLFSFHGKQSKSANPMVISFIGGIPGFLKQNRAELFKSGFGFLVLQMQSLSGQSNELSWIFFIDLFSGFLKILFCLDSSLAFSFMVSLESNWISNQLDCLLTPKLLYISQGRMDWIET